MVDCSTNRKRFAHLLASEIVIPFGLLHLFTPNCCISYMLAGRLLHSAHLAGWTVHAVNQPKRNIAVTVMVSGFGFGFFLWCFVKHEVYESSRKPCMSWHSQSNQYVNRSQHRLCGWFKGICSFDCVSVCRTAVTCLIINFNSKYDIKMNQKTADWSFWNPAQPDC